MLHDDVDGAAVFGVHADQSAVFRRRAQGFEDAGIVKHEHARIGHEKLETGDAFAGEGIHFLELRAGQIGDDAMEGVIADGFAGGLLHPGVEGCSQRLAFVLDGEVDQRGGSAEGGGASAGFKIVGAGGSAEGHVKVSVDVDSAGENILASSVNYLGGVRARQVLADGGNFAFIDGDIRHVSVGGGGHESVHDDGVKGHEWFDSCGGEAEILC